MNFSSDNTAAVHPGVWTAMQYADAADLPYGEDRLSARLDEAFSRLFDRECAAMSVATGTAANSLALATMVAPHAAFACHRHAHVATSECGAPEFYTHGAKLVLLEGAEGKIRSHSVLEVMAGMDAGDGQPKLQALSITQATEVGCAYSRSELEALARIARDKGLKLHMDGARFANAVAHLGCAPVDACHGVDALSFGCTKNGAMNAEALVFFDTGLMEVGRLRRKRGGHTQAKERFLAAQILALIESDLWLENARAANVAAQAIAEPIQHRLLYPVEANEVFVRLEPAERDGLRARGFKFYDWGDDAARFVTSWDSRLADATALGNAIAQFTGVV